MLKVNEIFGPTIQGEGKSAGKDVVFLRLSGCNLACVWCDTPYTWNWLNTPFQHPDKFDKAKEETKGSTDQVRDQLLAVGSDVKALVVSGGEPMLQQKQLLPLLRQLKEKGWWLEMETNGTVVPTDEILQVLDLVNCSPKLVNSGPDNRPTMREKPEALTKLAGSSKTSFKFVVVDQRDIPEIFQLVTKYNMQNVYLMPEGRTKAEQEKHQAAVELMAKTNGFNFSPRLHVLKWDNKRAV